MPFTGWSVEIANVPGAVPMPVSVALPSVVVDERTFNVAVCALSACGVNLTRMLQVPFAMTVPVLQPSVTMVNDVGFAPVRLVAMSAGEVTSPTLVATSVSVAPFVPTAAESKSVPDVDVMLKLAGFCPTPDADAFAVPPGLAVTDTDAVCCPRCLAVNCTETVQVSFGCSAAAQPDATNCVESLVDTVGVPVALVPTFLTV